MSEPCRRCHGTGLEPDWRSLGQRVRTVRLKVGLSVHDVARKLGVSASYVSDLELGRRAWQGPKARAILKLMGTPK